MPRFAATQRTCATVRSEGGLLPPDLLARIAAGDPNLPGLAPETYGLPKGEKLGEAAARAWTNVRAYWAALRAATGSLGARERGVTETRELWLLPLFRELGYGRLVYRPAAAEIDGRRYSISHQAGDGEGTAAPPIFTISLRDDIERAAWADDAASGLRISPHGLLQEYLNRTDHLWGIVTNGLRLRLLRDNASLSRAAFVEFDLEAMLEGGVYADFVLLFLLLHRSRLPGPGVPPEACWLERWREAAAAHGARALDELRAGVEKAIDALGRGLLEHPANQALRERLIEGALPVEEYYRQLLRLVYRMLFLLAAEERDLLFTPDADRRQREVYQRHYGMLRLRDLVEQRRHTDRYDDLWRSLGIAFAALRDEASGAALGLKPLAGGLFGPLSCPDLDGALVSNERLLEAVRGLTWFVDPAGRQGRRVNYRDMDVEELGSVYEGLLELQPVLQTAGERPAFALGHSGERKSTGSYYTNPGLVRELIASALEPTIAAALAKGRTASEQRQALLDLKVCDPACGSGHFLLAAARRIGREVARLDAGDTEPDPALVRRGARDAIQHCVYGVDLNPLAVDLCKLALWLEGHDPGKPLPFLDARIRHGNSLIGATEAAMAEGIPSEAFDPVAGDERGYATAIKRQNREERKGQASYEIGGWIVTTFATPDAVHRYFATRTEGADDLAAVRAQEAAYDRSRQAPEFRRRQTIADLWTAAFFWPLREGEAAPPTEQTWKRLATDPNPGEDADDGLSRKQNNSADARTARTAARLAARHRFFHWELEFPAVFDRDDPGFDCILGNPPWEVIQPEEKKWFAGRDDEIAHAAGAKRKRLIEALPQTRPALAAAWADFVRTIQQTSKFVRNSERFPRTGQGDLNTYSLFTEQATAITTTSGRDGIIVPTGIATDDGNKVFFSWLVREGRLASLYDFENRNAIFPGVHRSYKFSLLTATGAGSRERSFDAAFFLHDPAELREPGRTFRLSAAAIALLNPNTYTCPIFRSERDAAITTAIYRAAPVLARDEPPENPWGVTLRQGLFNMTSDSHLFQTRAELEGAGFALGEDGRFRRGGETWLPLYEAKLIHQFDHRFATYDAARQQTRDLTPAEHADPTCVALPRYWVAEGEVEKDVSRWTDCAPDWFMGWRDIARSTDERTFISSLFPRAGAGDTLLIMMPDTSYRRKAPALLANLNSFAFDFATRQKAGGTHLKFFTVKQLPALPPEAYTPELMAEIVPRVLELVYTAWDMAPFARDCGYDGPPFVWDETRRATLRADLDGIYAHLYGLSGDDFAYILDQFPVLRNNETRQFGEFRSRRLCLEAYERFGRRIGAAAKPSEVLPAPAAQPVMSGIAQPPAEGPGVAYPAHHAERFEAQPDGGAARLSVVEPRSPELRLHAGHQRYRQAAVVAWLAAQGSDDPNFGRTKLVKELYFLQHRVDGGLGLEFVREAAGPLDHAFYGIQNLAKRQDWLQFFNKSGGRVEYLPGGNADKAAEIARAVLGDHLVAAERLIAFFRPFDTLRMEQWATAHQVWDDRRREGEPLTYAGVARDILGWKGGKRGFDERSVTKVIAEMVNAGFITLDDPRTRTGS